MTPEETWAIALFAMRVVMVLALYGFLLFGFNAMRRELRATAATAATAATSDARAGRAWLEVVDGEGDVARIGERYLLAPVTTIGRGSGSTLRLDDPRVSTEHAQVRWRDGRWWVEDLGSTNGTFVAGRRVERPSPLADGAAFSIGPVRLRLVEADQ